uniref:Uncharacterized protein n=1 Tax=Rhizophora mucronata TaxID=61149 RepID=A0A2P2NVW3_RHIMU
MTSKGSLMSSVEAPLWMQLFELLGIFCLICGSLLNSSGVALAR